MKMIDHMVTTKNDRRIRVTEAGEPNGVPILVLNGTPASRLLYHLWVEDAEAQGIRLMSYDRPGYGGSTSQPGRSVADAAEDVATIARELKINSFLVWGVSGGGPHALACAALLPDLVVAAAALASPAPYKAGGLDWFAGMGEGNLTEFNAALKGREALAHFVEEDTAGILNTTASKLVQAFSSLLSPVDSAALTEDLAGYLLDAIREGIQKSGDGWIDDDLAFIHEWGFKLDQISIPVMLMQGAQDKMVPFSHGKWLANHIPNVDAQLLPEEGHLSLQVNRIHEVHKWLLGKMK